MIHDKKTYNNFTHSNALDSTWRSKTEVCSQNSEARRIGDFHKKGIKLRFNIMGNAKEIKCISNFQKQKLQDK